MAFVQIQAICTDTGYFQSSKACLFFFFIWVLIKARLVFDVQYYFVLWQCQYLRLQAGLFLCQGYVPEKVIQIEIVQIEHKIPI